jgi:hypothetical protein
MNENRIDPLTEEISKLAADDSAINSLTEDVFKLALQDNTSDPHFKVGDALWGERGDYSSDVFSRQLPSDAAAHTDQGRPRLIAPKPSITEVDPLIPYTQLSRIENTLDQLLSDVEMTLDGLDSPGASVREDTIRTLENKLVSIIAALGIVRGVESGNDETNSEFRTDLISKLTDIHGGIVDCLTILKARCPDKMESVITVDPGEKRVLQHTWMGVNAHF